MTETLTDWLRAELAADREAAAEKSLVDWVVAVVETVVALAVVVRLSIAAGVWAIHHGEPESPLNPNPFDAPISNDAWTRHDAIEVAALCVVLPTLFTITHDLAALDWTAETGYLGLQVLALGFEPVRVGFWELR